ncbi:hypothetical protein B0H17DRAFT_1137105 [Mycena rosella]|uniref:Fungal STAND N-terminal Goodbye domain-containing protein n=1 Tax=Mycena rosella TaxID=1033263 RepID=A0AAD7GF44_MYCRO|nr:hypothetical protein B0H17DRAFT_1137105 [Mycena rosella]
MHSLRASESDSILQHVQTAIGLLRDIAEGSNVSYLNLPIAGITLLILETVHVVKTNREHCLQMVEQIYDIVCAIINVLELDTAFSSAMLHSVYVYRDAPESAILHSKAARVRSGETACAAC